MWRRLRSDVAASRRGWWPLLSASAMAGTDHAYGYALVVLGPEVARSLDLSIGAIAALAMFRGIAFFVAGGLVERTLRHVPVSRARLTTIAASMRVVALLLTGLHATPWTLVFSVTLYGLASVSTPFAYGDIVESTYGDGRTVAAFHRAALRIGNVLSAAAIVPVVLLAPAHWQTVFVVLGIVSAFGPAGALIAGRRLHTGPGETIRPSGPAHDLTAWFTHHPASQALLLAFAVVGIFEVPLYVYAFGDLSAQWAIGASTRAAVAASFEAGGLIASAIAVRNQLRGGRTRKPPAIGIIGLAMLVAAAVLGAMITTSALSGFVALWFLAMGALGFVSPLLFASTLTMLPPLRRQYWSALPTTLFVAIALGLTGTVAWVGTAFGSQAAVASFGVPAAVVGLLLITASRTLDPLVVPAWWTRWPRPVRSDG